MRQEFERRKRVVRKVPSERVLEEVVKGNKFIVLENDIETVPEGYMVVDMKYKEESFKTLVPQQLLFFLANPGEGSIDDALDGVADFYNEVEDFEDEAIANGKTSVQDVNWATTSREAYRVYVINKLTGDGKKFERSILEDLCLDTQYVEQRAKGIAALALGKSPEAMKKAKLSDILTHVTVQKEEKTVREKLRGSQLNEVRCYAGSHYELRSEYKNVPGVKYELGSGGSVTKTQTVVNETTIPIVEKKISQLEEEIQRYRIKKGKEIKRHDRDLLRQYINLSYIAQENPNAQLDIEPPEKIKEDDTK